MLSQATQFYFCKGYIMNSFCALADENKKHKLQY